MLPALDRLRKNKLFKQCFSRGRSYGGPYFLLKVQHLPHALVVREIGFSVSRKVGSAVQRNRVKRQLRAIVRGLLHRLVFGYRVVIVLRPASAAASYADLLTAFLQQAESAGLMLQTVQKSNTPEHSISPVDGV
jgi:ribonuclease P protein component